MIAALVAGVATGLAGAALVELLAERPRRPPRRRGVLALAMLAAVGRRAGGGDRAPDGRGAVVVGGSPAAAGGRLDALVEGAGVRLAAGDVAAIRAGGALVALAAVVPFAWALSPRGALTVLLAAPGAAFLLPTVLLERRGRRRAAVVEDEIADLLDLLAVALDAGLAPVRAVAEVGRRHHGVLAAELRRMAARRALGVPAATAITDLERRCPTEGVTALCASLRRAERHGAPLATALVVQSRQARSRAAARTAEAAARASPRIQLVVALLLVPSVLLLVAAGLLPALTGR
jgi:tight adherence protein C